MKAYITIVIFAISVLASNASADIFQYTDNNGTLVMVDDESKIPARYKKKVKTRIVEAVEVSPLNRSTGVTVHSNRIYVPVRFSYQGRTVEARLLLDTGASITTITPLLAQRLGLNSSNTTRSLARVADGRTVQAYLTKLDSITVGPKVKYNVDVSILPRVENSSDDDGLLGMNFLRDFTYSLDINNQSINWMH